MIAVTAALAASATGCSSSSSSPGAITVLAAASLQEAFTALGQQFEAANPGVKVQFSFGASSALAEQINSGAPADVFASASPANMAQVVDAGGASASTNFVKNVMEIAVPPGNPANITSVADLAKSTVKVALCQPQVPCGAVAAQVFQNANITVTPVTLEADVKSTLSKVELGEVDAGVVYVTDVRSAGDQVLGVPIPDDINASTEYPIAALTKAPNAAGAQAFVSFVLSPAGQSVLAAAGFERP
ncbi:MAG: molybdate ABC transporter substrate-binding protein [Micrococcales bacterium]|nr:molybdate ABC transporter substrate-binding protein [Micrococcales bacterium]